MSERKAVIRQTMGRYKKASKKGKTKILDEFVKVTQYDRKYAGWILRNFGKTISTTIKDKPVKIIIGKPTKKRKLGRKPIYQEKELLEPLKMIWRIFDLMCGKRLEQAIKTNLDVFIKLGVISLTKKQRKLLLQVSASTIDRMLQKEKRKFNLKGKSFTKPGTLLKHQIPIKSHSQWDDTKPGYLEIDLVAHCGGNSRGEFNFTLTATDVATGWTEPIAVLNKAQVWTFEAIKKAISLFPFEVLGIHSDNGGEFINEHLKNFCEKNNIQFTRTRPYRKNDNCYVEQKNNSVVRNTVGYQRYDTKHSLKLLNQIYGNLRLLKNYFYPSMKLLTKERIGSRIRKKYDTPQTPMSRVLNHKEIDAKIKKELKARFDDLNPVAFKREQVHLVENLKKYSLKREKNSFG